MDVDVIDLFLKHLGPSEQNKDELKAEINISALERAAAELEGTLSHGDRDAVLAFAADPDSVPEENIRAIFTDPHCQEALADSVWSVLNDLMDDPDIFTPASRDRVLSELEGYMQARQVLAV